ncbi:DUF2505 domain-containing protein [Rhodococcus chondri]|uniref:DUF2505 domain-containing protein n=1 Tax=Rhodococcus chondri TaxID=3065941 RepID=A0ABU7JTR3_9NOCA|nr:DUF2505 domain-containing protein [Rhodococcus sp. CC-R104]MEE2033418.1 DUF2505 domain-containing protein [Rhodococcus sp. CC-R104]
MSKEFVYTIELDHGVEHVHAALISEEYWKGRVGDSTTGSVEVMVPAGPGTARITLTDQVDAAVLPAVVRGILRGPLVMTRTDEWGVLEGNTASGALGGGSSTLPVTIAARSELRPRESSGSVIELRGEARVDVPIVGGQVEGMVLQMMQAIVESDRATLNTWLSR